VVDSFDAGTLGALTLTYASCEMIEGNDPSPSDDLYALGIIAYQLYTGNHPYKKLSATEARDKGLHPKRLKNVNRHQWRAINSALKLDRNSRVQSAEEFVKIFNGPSRLKKSITILLLALFIVSGYFLYHLNYIVTTQVDFNDLTIEKNLTLKNNWLRQKWRINLTMKTPCYFT